MAAALAERTNRRPASHACRFCAVKPGKGILAKTRSLTTQLIQFQYTDAFYFYFAKPINEILSQTRSPEFLAFAEAVIESSRPKIQICHYTAKDAQSVLARVASKAQTQKEGTRGVSSSKTRPELAQYEANPFLLNATGMMVLRKCQSRKQIGGKRTEEDFKEKKRANRCKEQMPLRAGDLLKGSKLFVDPDSFETEMFDIYSPKFSSDEECSKLLKDETMQNKLKEAELEIHHQNFKRPWAWTLPHPRSYTEVGKVQIPLLKLGANQMTAIELSKLGLKPTAYQSENQSTQFSSSYNPQLQAKVRRKQVLEDLASKMSPGFATNLAEGQTLRSMHQNASIAGFNSTSQTAQTQNQGTQMVKPSARLDFSPKLNRKRQNKDKKEQRAGEPDKEVRETLERISRDPRIRNLGKSSLLNSNSWQMGQSWDHIINKPLATGPINLVRMEEQSNTAPQSARGMLGRSQETFKASKPYTRNSSRKAGPSPENTTDRGFASGPSNIRDKFGLFKSESQQICLTKRLRKPMWISVGQNNLKNSSVRNRAALMTSRTVDKSMVGLSGVASNSKARSKDRTENTVGNPSGTFEPTLVFGKQHLLESKPKKSKLQNRSLGKLVPTKVTTATTIQFGPSIATKAGENSKAGPSGMGSSSSSNFAGVIAQKCQTSRPMMAARRMAAGTITSPHQAPGLLSVGGPSLADVNNVSLLPHRLQTEGNQKGYMWPCQPFMMRNNPKGREAHSFGYLMSSGGPNPTTMQFIPGLGLFTAKKEGKKTNTSRSRSMTKRGTATSSTGALTSSGTGNQPSKVQGGSVTRKRSQSKKQSSGYLTSRTKTE